MTNPTKIVLINKKTTKTKLQYEDIFWHYITGCIGLVSQGRFITSESETHFLLTDMREVISLQH